jgi:L-ascorbate metabolism protein UlaG (beta-lactamase superfamily)
MKITKIGHCCLVIEENGVKIMTDPGNFSTGQDEVTAIHAVLITHEHADHLHIESLKKVLANNPTARVITNNAVSEILKKENIACDIVGHKDETDVNGLLVQGFGDTHAEIYITVPSVENTGYMIGGKLFYPGDAFYDPGCPVHTLALPVAGPWMKISDAIEYARTVHPKVCFPVHDGMYKDPSRFQQIPAMILEKVDINFVLMAEGETKEF